MIISQVFLAYGTYLVATISPGPSNMAIMGTAMRYGRGPALFLSAGVVTGSLFWAVIAATSISTILASYRDALLAIKVLGSFYLLYLGFRAGRSAISKKANSVDTGAERHKRSPRQLYRDGVLMHIGNPKALMAWAAIMSLGLQEDASVEVLLAILLGCALLGVLVFAGYAVLFSSAPMIAFYLRLQRWIEGSLCIIFWVAGLKLLTSDI